MFDFEQQDIALQIWLSQNAHIEPGLTPYRVVILANGKKKIILPMPYREWLKKFGQETTTKTKQKNDN